jgi:OmpA-OmpF porin, OOP family
MIRTTALGFALFTVLLLSQGITADKEGCKDHPLFSRMPNFELYNCSTVQFEAVEFAKPGRKEYENPEDFETVEGPVFFVSYALKEGVTPPSALQIIRNFQNAAKAAGGVILGDYAETRTLRESATKFMVESPGGTSFDRYTNLKFTKGTNETWVTVAASNAYNDYCILVVERQAMNQDIAVSELVEKLNKDGFITLYVNFDTNKAVIKPESGKTLDDAAGVLKAAPTLSVIVGGHTDNVGTPETNLRLSDERAKAVMAALIQRGITADRLTAKGFGQTEPIADNRTEDGRAKNRRVELVKK